MLNFPTYPLLSCNHAGIPYPVGHICLGSYTDKSGVPGVLPSSVSLDLMELHDELATYRPRDERLGLLDALVVNDRCLEIRIDRCEE